VTDQMLPQEISLDLDAVERPEKDVVPPFAVKVGGKRIEMTDPDEIDWKDLAELDDPIGFLRYALNDEDRAHLREVDLPGWKFRRLMDGYMAHYKLNERVAEAQRMQGRAPRF